jgi:hypothetical protein
MERNHARTALIVTDGFVLIVGLAIYLSAPEAGPVRKPAVQR